MKKIVITVLLAMVSLSPAVFADGGPFGLGIILGEPTGISAKLWLGDTHAVDAAVAWSFQDEGSFYIHGSYLFHMPGLISVDRGSLPVYIGVGGKISLRDEPHVGVRVPVGLSYIVPTAPVDLFVEIAPGIGSRV